MTYASLTPEYAVAPQIGPDDVPALVEAGFRTVICNRPDDEVPADLSAEAMRAVIEAAGLAFVLNPVTHNGLSLDVIDAQGAATEAAAGPVLAYCRSGTRSTVVWALSQAGKRPADEILADCRAGGYDMPMLKGQIEALASR